MNKDAVVLVPCYDPDEKITLEFLKKLSKKFKNIVLIDDGCDKKYDKFWKNLKKDYAIVINTVNLGKGRGIKNGINYILENYPKCKSIITADCDGQHSVEDIEKCFKKSLENQDSLIIGSRDFNKSNVPLRSRYGNKLTRNILKLFVGQSVSDTQTGLRAMSYEVALKLIAVDGERYEYETNVLINCKNKNIPIVEVGIETIYIDDNRTSHFNPVKDSIKIYRLFGNYFLSNFILFLFESFLFILFSDTPIPGVAMRYNVFFALLNAKLLVNFILLIVNKYINIVKVVFEFILTILLFNLVNWQIDLYIVKIIIDIILLLLFIIFTRVKQKF